MKYMNIGSVTQMFADPIRLFRKDRYDRHGFGVAETNLDECYATCLGDQITARQILEARKSAKRAGHEPDSASDLLFGCSLTELSRKGAEQLIEFLDNSARRRSSALQVRLAG